MVTTRLATALPAIIAAAVLAAVPTVAAGTSSPAFDAGAAEHAALPARAFVWSLIVNVGREGAAEHASLR
jgi:hypothetical protein